MSGGIHAHMSTGPQQEGPQEARPAAVPGVRDPVLPGARSE